MKIITSIKELPSPFGPSVVTLGNFDGVHLGHRELFRAVWQSSHKLSCPAVVCTFNPHPLKFLAPDKAPPLLNTLAEKRRLIAASHVDYLVEIPFTRDLAVMSPEQFIEEILIGKLQVSELVVGYDYAFGKGRKGNAEFLAAYGAKAGFHVNVLQPVSVAGEPYSSTRIRNLIMAGDVAEAKGLLGRHYNFEGEVVPGFKRGRKMGFPTANLITDKELIPASGVYAVKVRHNLQEFDGVINLGNRPTFTDGNVTIEVHLLDFSGDLYGERLRVYFVERLREEKKYDNIKDLADAIADDVLRARQILQATQIVQYQEYLSLR